MNFTNNVFLNVLMTVLYAFAIMFLFNLVNIYFLKKYVINKWIALGVSLALFVVSIVWVGFYPAGLWHLIPLTISLFAFMWFLDLRRRFKPKKNEKTFVMKPKAKPNRARQVTKTDEKPVNNTKKSGK